jgi:hypothetical protein
MEYYEATASIDSIDEVEARGEPFRVFNPMALDSSRLGQEIYSPSPITIGNVTVWSATPIRIIGTRFSEYGLVHIEPTASLQPSFVKGWNTLPDELKERILWCSVVTGIPKENRETTDLIYHFEILMHHLRTTPEMAKLACDMYYKHNTFVLEPHSDFSLPWVFGRNRPKYLRYPKLSVNMLIRSVIFICGIYPAEWELLSRFARGDYGFENLRQLKLTFLARDFLRRLHSFSQFLGTVVAGGLRFACEGDLVVQSERPDFHGWDSESEDTAEELAQMRRMETMMRRVIKFGCSKSKRGVIAEEE